MGEWYGEQPVSFRGHTLIRRYQWSYRIRSAHVCYLKGRDGFTGSIMRSYAIGKVRTDLADHSLQSLHICTIYWQHIGIICHACIKWKGKKPEIDQI